MFGRIARRYGYPIAVLTLLAGIVVMLGVVMTVIVLPELAAPSTAVEVSPSPSASTGTNDLSPMASSPMGIAMSTNADCSACHLTPDGVGTKQIPEMAHPLEGWTDCTACHANDRLVATAPGHSGLHKDQCLICHTPRSATETAAPERPHHVFTGQTCLECHGTKAPLPTDMTGRQNCWICHPGEDTAALFGGSPTASPPP
jgi:hypothetical protein